MTRRHPISTRTNTLFPHTTLFRSYHGSARLGPPAPAAESLPAGQPRSTEAGGGGRVPEAGRRGDSAAALRRSLCLQSRPWHRPGYAAGARGPDDGADPRLARNRGPRAMSRTAVVLFTLGGPEIGSAHV